MGNAVGSGWNYYRKTKGHLFAVGDVRIRFSIDKDGKVADVQVISNTGSSANAAYAIRSVKEAEFPPIPAERLARMDKDRYFITLTLTTLPIQ